MTLGVERGEGWGEAGGETGTRKLGPQTRGVQRGEREVDARDGVFRKKEQADMQGEETSDYVPDTQRLTNVPGDFLV